MAINSTRQLVRTRSGLFAGVCGGLADYFGMNLAFVRLTFLVLTLSYGVGLLLYILLMLVMPLETAMPRTTAEVASTPPPRRTLAGYITAFVAMTGTIAAFLTNVSTVWGFVEPTYYPPPPVQQAATAAPFPHESSTQENSGVITLNSLNGMYVLNQQSDTSPDTYVTTVVVSDAATEITIEVVNPSPDESWIQVYPPGSRDAFFLVSPDGAQVYPLRSVEGVAVVPEQVVLLADETRDFTLTFDRIPDSLSQFHLIEGVTDHPDMIEWVFSNLTLYRE